MPGTGQNRGLYPIGLCNSLAEGRQQGIDALAGQSGYRQRRARKIAALADEVDLVPYQDCIGPGPSRGAARLIGALPVEDKQPDLGFFGTLQSAPQTLPLDYVLAVPQSSGVGEYDRVPVQVDRNLDNVSRGARDRRGNGRLTTRYLIEKTGFSGIWRADDRDHDPVSQPFTSVSVRKVPLDLGDQRFGLTENAVFDLGRQILVGKIDRRLEMGESTGQALAPAAVEITKLTVELAKRLTTLCLGLGRGEIGDGFGLYEIELAIEKGASGEFAGFGNPQPEAAEHLHNRGKHGATAVQMKLGDILTGDAARGREPQHEPVIEPLTGLGVDQTSSPRYARRRQPARQQRYRATAFRPAEAQDGNGGAARRRRRGEDCVGSGRPGPQCFGGSCSGCNISRLTRPPFLTCVSRISSMSWADSYRYHTPSG